ncbi:hypothetical protein AB0J80_04035 [Actinoplanes sp. NPDC049548]|uniref:hypothetical protein n=1 Tax=Actinoplanes sp. NPDC049548 TaxID=3155152 RepID=UPI003441FBBF
MDNELPPHGSRDTLSRMTSPPLNRPTLLPGLFRTWRDAHTLQLGLRPGTAVLIDFPHPESARLLDLLDGSRSERDVLRRAVTAGVPPADARALLDSLHQVGLVVPAQSLYPSASDATRLSGEALTLALAAAPGESGLSRPIDGRLGRGSDISLPPSDAADSGRPHRAEPPDGVEPEADLASPRSSRRPTKTSPGVRSDSPATALRRRRGARITVTGRGRLSAGIAVALAESGIGHVHADLPGTVSRQDRLASPLRDTDIGRPRAQAVTEAVLRAAPSTETRAIRRGGASLVVQLSHDQPIPLLAFGYAHRRQPHLTVTVREATAVIGPLVPAAGGPCLHCLHLHRQDRDPHTGSPQPPPVDDEPCAVATILAATAYAVAEVLAFVDGRLPETLGAEVEISSPARVRRRSWTPHPNCACNRTFRAEPRRRTGLREPKRPGIEYRTDGDPASRPRPRQPIETTSADEGRATR